MTAVVRIAVSALRSRWRSAVLVAVVFAATAACAATALAARNAVSGPWDRLFAETRGAHVRIDAATLEEARELAAAIPGVVETDESRRLLFTAMQVDGEEVPVAVVVTEGEGSLDRPTGSGTDAGVWIEHSHASALGLVAGDPVSLERADGSWARTQVGAVVSSALFPPYPQRVPGLAFLTEEERERLGLAAPQVASLSVRVADPAAVDELVLPPGAMVSTWQEVRDAAIAPALAFQTILDAFSVLLLGCATALTAVTIGGQVAADRRRFLLITAAGCTPSQVGWAAAIEHASTAAVGALAGVGVAAWVSPDVLRSAGPDLGIPPPGLGVVHAAAVVATIALLAAAVSWTATTRTVTSATIADRDQRPRLSRLGTRGLDSRMPVGIALGAKDAFGRPARAAMTVLVVALAVVAVVGALSVEATFDAAERGGTVLTGTGPGGLPPIEVPDGAGTDDQDRLRSLVYGLEVLLLVVAAATVFLAVSLDVRERRREAAGLLAAGVTPRQLATARIAGTVVAGLVAAVVGLPLGVGFFLGAYQAANGTTEDAAIASPGVLALAALVLIALLANVSWAAAASATRIDRLRDTLRPE